MLSQTEKCDSMSAMARSKPGEGDKPQPVNVGLLPPVNEALDSILGDLSKKKTVVNRVMAWFCRQIPAVRTAILSETDEGFEHQYADLFEHLADDLRRRRPDEHDLAVGVSPQSPPAGTPQADPAPAPKLRPRRNTPPKSAPVRADRHSRG